MRIFEPFFLTRSQVERLHAMGLARFGGSAGIRDDGLIDSELGSAKNTFFYDGGDLYDIAAAYVFHLAESQAFIDGNKRTGIGAALTFLELNGAFTRASDDELYDAMIAIADKRQNKDGLAAILRATKEN